MGFMQLTAELDGVCLRPDEHARFEILAQGFFLGCGWPGRLHSRAALSGAARASPAAGWLPQPPIGRLGVTR
ncbi:MAG TPA: hypothetical protein P5022_11070, partial [Candidatus Paceibacterota bacterium]|nr:hypothetical protein [Candidatus Paceibacterota bacterium]